MPEINILDKQTAQLIAAGEVVERPSSVVKELMENSIDAGATVLTVEIRRGGVTYIRITDNGCGIDRANIKKAFISHATSKIAKEDDLNSIMTLGFRGEALASVAAVARVEMLTRADNEEIGTRYVIEGSQEVLLDDAGCPKGTTIIVRDLFYNTPARMKFLKKDVTEANAVAAVVDRIALSHPEVAVTFIREGKEVLSTPGDGKIKNTVLSVFGREFTDSLIECGYELNGVKADGFISKPVNARANRTMQFFFLNGRLIKTRTGTAALEQAYKNSIMVGRFPACIINITIPPAAVDVNVHPAKTEVRFADEKKIFDAVYYSVKYALESRDTRPQMSFESKSKIKLASQLLEQLPQARQISFNQKDEAPAVRVVDKAPAAPIPERRPITVSLNSPDEFVPSKDIESDEDLLLRNAPVKKADATPAVEIAPETHEETADEITAPVVTPDEPKAAEPFTLIGEAFKTYILAEQGDKILIIDKHAAHERIIFEKLKANADGVESQMLIAPIAVPLSKEEYDSILSNTDLLSDCGYEISDFGQGMVIVTQCPSYLESGDIEPVVTELAAMLGDNKNMLVTEKLDWIYHSTACRAAIKAGDKTSPYEMQKFVEKLLSMPDIRYCPHGRPVLIEMSKREIEKNFGRV